jgi:hypothetical protein
MNLRAVGNHLEESAVSGGSMNDAMGPDGGVLMACECFCHSVGRRALVLVR